MLRILVQNGSRQFATDDLRVGVRTFEIECEALENLIKANIEKPEGGSIKVLGIEIFECVKLPPLPLAVMIPDLTVEQKLDTLRDRLTAHKFAQENKTLAERLFGRRKVQSVNLPG